MKFILIYRQLQTVNAKLNRYGGGISTGFQPIKSVSDITRVEAESL